ncbi:MAG: phosphate acyltransferase [Micavibrio sp.]|nr:phosphate acyltransferase [Micavibrio sp.]
MTKKVKIAIDAMGGDHGVDATIPGAAKALDKDGDLHFLFYGDEAKIRPVLSKYPKLKASSETIHTDHAVRGDEKPAAALRTGRQSSMRLAINSVSNNEADCIVSSGNTGALMAMAKMVLKTLPNIRRPAIASVLPSKTGRTVMLDLGANLSCDSEVLIQFALMGAVYARISENKKNPSVGLLNVGSEDMKGHEELRAAHGVLSRVQFPGSFKGFVEGNDIPMGTVDVVVTDGFTGNIALKTAEGVGKLTEFYLKETFKSSLLATLGGVLAMPALKKMKQKVDPRFYNGGMFLGLDGVCLKSHGSSDDVGFCSAIIVAANLIRNDFNSRISEEIDKLMNQESFFTHELVQE